MAEIGSAYLTVVPSARGFWANASRQLAGGGRTAGQQQGREFASGFQGQAGQQMQRTVRQGLQQGDQARTSGASAGQQFGQGFGDRAQNGMLRVIRDDQGRLRHESGRFLSQGEIAGGQYVVGFSRHMQGIMQATERGQAVAQRSMSRHMQGLMQQTTRQLGEGGAQAGQRFGTGLMGRLTGSLSNVGSSMRGWFSGVSRQAEESGGSIGGSLGSSLFGAFNGYFLSVTAGITGLVGMAKTAIDQLNFQDRSKITYSAVLNIDTSQADALVKKIAKLDQLLPATAQDLNTVATRFAPFSKSADDLYGMTEAFAKSATAFGASSDEMTRAAVQVGQSMSTGSLRFADWKIAMPSIAGMAPKLQAEISKVLGGKDFNDALTNHLITPEVFQKALTNLAKSPQVAKGMDAMSNTVEARWSSAVGSFQMGLERAAEKYKPQLLQITDWIGTAMQGSVHTFSAVLAVVAKAVDVFAPLAAAVGKWATSHKELVGALKVSVGVFAAVTLGAWAMSTGFGAVSFAIRGIGLAIKGIPVFGWIVAAIAAVSAAAVFFYKTNDTFRESVNRAWETVKSAVASALDYIRPALDGAVSLFGRVKTAFSDVFSILTKGDYTGGLAKAFGIEEDSPVVGALLRIRDAFFAVRDGVGAAADFLRGKLADLAKYLGPWLSFAGEQFSAMWKSIKGIFTGIAGLVGDVFTGFVLPTLRKFTGFVTGTLWPALQRIAKNLAPVFQLAGRIIVGVVGGAILGLRGILAVIDKAIVPVIRWVWDNVLSPILNGVAWLITKVVLPAVTWLAEALSWAIGGIATVILWVWDNAIKPAFTWLWDFITNTLGPAIQWWWENVTKPVFDAIGAAATWLWEHAIKPAFEGWQIYFTTILAPALQWLWDSVVKPVFGWIGGKVSDTWNLVIRPALGALRDWMTRVLAPAMQALWEVVRAVWDRIAGKISAAWNGQIKPMFTALEFGLQGVTTAFRIQVDAMGTIWDTLRAKVRDPIKFVLRDIVVGKLFRGWNAVADKVGGALPKMPDNPEWAQFARGGWTGPGGKYDPAGIVHADEFVVRKESRGSIEREAPGLLDALNRYGAKALNRLAPGYADGGQVSKVQFFLQKLLSKQGARYVLGAAHTPKEWANPAQNVFDCSGFMNWGITQTGLKPIGYTAATIGRGNPQIGLGRAQSTPGAFLYRTSSPHAGTTGHIAASLGNGQTIEAMGSKYGVRKGSATGRFEGGSMHPGLVGSLSAEEQAALAEAIASSDGWSMPNAAAEIAKALVSPFFSGAKSLITGMLGMFGSTDLVKLVAGTGTSMVSGVESFIDKMIDKVFPAFTLGGTGAGAQLGAGDAGESAGGDVRAIVQSVAAKYGWGTGPQWEALSWIIGKESGWNPTAQNPHSTAYGLFQFLNSTWAGLGFSKSSSPLVQAQAGMKYIHDRYASPLGAKAFWQSHGWYADGGRVLPLRPTLYDTGGILPPGISLVQNETGKPETIRTHEQERDVQRQINSGATYNLQIDNVDSRDRIAQLMEALRQKEIRDRAKARVMARA